MIITPTRQITITHNPNNNKFKTKKNLKPKCKTKKNKKINPNRTNRNKINKHKQQLPQILPPISKSNKIYLHNKLGYN